MSELNILISTVDGETPITILHLSGHLHGETEGPLLEQVRQLHQSGTLVKASLNLPNWR